MKEVTALDKQKGKRLEQLRRQLNLTQSEFGQKLSRSGKVVSQNYLSAIENGRLPMGDDIQARVEARFNVRGQWLNEGVGEMFAPGSEEIISDQQLRVKAALENAAPTKRGNLVWVSVRERGLFLRSDASLVGLNRSVFPILSGILVAFEVADIKMLPDFVPGSYAICSELLTPADLLVGYPYFIRTSSTLLLATFEGQEGEQLRFKYTNDPTPIRLETDQILQLFHIEYKLLKP